MGNLRVTKVTVHGGLTTTHRAGEYKSLRPELSCTIEAEVDGDADEVAVDLDDLQARADAWVERNYPKTVERAVREFVRADVSVAEGIAAAQRGRRPGA